MTQRASLQTDKQLYPSISEAVHSSGSFSPVRLCASEGPTDSFPHMWRFCNNSWWQLFYDFFVSTNFGSVLLLNIRVLVTFFDVVPELLRSCCLQLQISAGSITEQRLLLEKLLEKSRWCFGWQTDQRRFFRPLFVGRKYILRFSRCDERLSHQQDKITCQIPVAV